ncbi:MAG TPA: hypothetical protein VGX28_03755 [Frankiaceae bacterium]|jgi:hypothetical protein|nr:hypothetical protein [Frankiaceae bacterium]
MRLRLVPALAAATLLLAVPANAATDRPQVRDPKGDVKGGMAELDIVSARWSTTGKGDAMRLVATLTLAAPPKKDVPYIYDMKSQVRDCGTLWFQYTPGTVMTRADDVNHPLVSDGDTTATVWTACGSGAEDSDGRALLYKELQFVQAGNTISWSVPVSALPDRIEVGSVFYDFSAIADVGDPVVGHSPQSIAGGSLDSAYGDGTWRLR